MKDTFMLMIIAALPPVTLTIIIVAGLVLAAVIAVAAVFLLRSSKKKGAGAKAPTNGSSGWQPSNQQQAPGAWNQQGTGAAGQGNNPWGQQQQADGWGAQANSPQQQQAGSWGAQPNMPQQQGSWGTQASMPQQQGSWGAQANVPQQQAGGWSAPATNAPQQAAAWGTQDNLQQQPGWGAPATNAPQQQQAESWGATQQAAPNAANMWNNPAAGTQAASSWNNQGAQPQWDATPAPSAQDAWAQPQGNTWNAPPPAPQGQQAATAYGGNSNPAWNPTGFVAGQAPADAWAPQAAQPYQSTPAAPAGNAPWQQGGGFGQGGIQQDNMYGIPEGDKTILRTTGPQIPQSMPMAGSGSLGVVRVKHGKEENRVYNISKESLSIGRSRESDIFLEDLAVSRLHASILNQGNGAYALKDEGSANGTKVNDQLVNKYQIRPLQPGDEIQLGQTILVFEKR